MMMMMFLFQATPLSIHTCMLFLEQLCWVVMLLLSWLVILILIRWLIWPPHYAVLVHWLDSQLKHHPDKEMLSVSQQWILFDHCTDLSVIMRLHSIGFVMLGFVIYEKELLLLSQQVHVRRLLKQNFINFNLTS